MPIEIVTEARATSAGTNKSGYVLKSKTAREQPLISGGKMGGLVA